MNEFPQQLNNKEFRFVLVRERSKKPDGETWQIVEAESEKLINHLKQGKNYGILSGYGGIVIVDIDKHSKISENDLIGKFESIMPRTFATRGSKGRHYYYICKDLPEQDKSYIALKIDDEDIGELRYGKGCQTIAPGS